MEIIGRGFIATNLARIADRHPDAVAFCIGPSSSVIDSPAEFDREAETLYQVIDRCRARGRKLVYFSTASSALYGMPGSSGVEDGPVFPRNAYGRHKLAMECVIRSAGVAFLVLRLTNLVGDHQRPHQLMTTLVRHIRAGVVAVHAGASRDLLDIAHMVEILDVLLGEAVTDEVVNVASGVAVPIEDLIAYLERRFGTVSEKRYQPARTAAQCPVSLDKLSRLAPVVREFGFGPDYYRTVVDRYVPAGEKVDS